VNKDRRQLELSFSAFSFTAMAVCLFFVSIAAGAAYEPQALEAIGLRELVEIDPGLTGLGVRIAVVGRSATYTDGVPQGDYRFDARHSAFWDANTSFEDGTDAAGYSNHETAIGGILLGSDPNAYSPLTGQFTYRGACPKAMVEAFEFWRFASLYIYGERHFEADILTFSLGDIFPSWWTRGVENLITQKNLVVFAAAGNGRNAGDAVLYPAAGSNVIAVGVVNAAIDPNSGNKSLGLFASVNPAFSSVGPTADARCKPDIVAPGRSLIPIVNSQHDYSIEGDWSSLATPMAAGAAALLMQKARTEPNIAVSMFASNTNCVIKAILLTSADKLPYWHKGRAESDDDERFPLDFAQGAGLLNIIDAYDLMLEGRQSGGQTRNAGWDNSILEPNASQVAYEFKCNDAHTIITATLCWNRVYQPQYPYPPAYEKDADLRLELWGVDPNNPEYDVLVDVSDSANDNVEHLYTIADNQFNHYRLVVRFSGKTDNPQRYAIAWMSNPEKNSDNPFWYDLNNDGKVNSDDRLIYFMIDHNRTQWLETEIGNSAIRPDSNRLQTLTTHWQIWKHYLTHWSSAQ
jgi:hypothetical protein